MASDRRRSCSDKPPSKRDPRMRERFKQRQQAQSVGYTAARGEVLLVAAINDAAAAAEDE